MSEYEVSVVKGKITSFIKEKRYDDCEKIIEKILFIDGSNTELLNLLGLIKYRLCKFSEANLIWTKSFEIDRNYKAKEYLKYIDENQFIRKYYTAIELVKRHNTKESIEVLKSINEDFFRKEILLSFIYIKNKRYILALKEIEKIKLGNKEANIYYYKLKNQVAREIYKIIFIVSIIIFFITVVLIIVFMN